MAATTITITYTAPTAADTRKATPISPTYVAPTTYADTTAYNGTVYDTNVAGFGSIAPKFPYDQTSFPLPIPLAQFQAAMVGTSNVVTITTEDQMEIMYYKQAGELLKDQGFTVAFS